MLLAASALALPHGSDLAAAVGAEGERLSAAPPIWLHKAFLDEGTVSWIRQKIPSSEDAWQPCVGQVKEFASKRCTLLPVEGDGIMTKTLESLGSAFDIDISALRAGLPVIRYLPGAPPVGLHGDMGHDGLVPNATLVLYLTDMDSGSPSGQTIFPECNVTVTPHAGSLLSFQNVDALGAPHPMAKHSVSAVPADAKSDRLVVQIPILHEMGRRARAYPEHVSGPGKQPGEHEALHGTPAQKAAYQAALAAGATLTAAYLAAKAGKWDGDEQEKKETEEKVQDKTE